MMHALSRPILSPTTPRSETGGASPSLEIGSVWGNPHTYISAAADMRGDLREGAMTLYRGIAALAFLGRGQEAVDTLLVPKLWKGAWRSGHIQRNYPEYIGVEVDALTRLLDPHAGITDPQVRGRLMLQRGVALKQLGRTTEAAEDFMLASLVRESSLLEQVALARQHALLLAESPETLTQAKELAERGVQISNQLEKELRRRIEASTIDPEEARESFWFLAAMPALCAEMYRQESILHREKPGATEREIIAADGALLASLGHFQKAEAIMNDPLNIGARDLQGGIASVFYGEAVDSIPFILDGLPGVQCCLARIEGSLMNLDSSPFALSLKEVLGNVFMHATIDLFINSSRKESVANQNLDRMLLGLCFLGLGKRKEGEGFLAQVRSKIPESTWRELGVDRLIELLKKSNE